MDPMDGKAGDAAGVAASPDRSQPQAAAPAWVGTAVWRGIWQLIAAVLITATALWMADRPATCCAI